MKAQMQIVQLGAVIIAVTQVAVATLPAAERAKAVANTDQPLLYTDLEKFGFKKDFKKLTEDERAKFYRIYPADKEMLSRARLGLIDPQPIQECIAGEAPTLGTAQKKFPLHYPMMGRMKDVVGEFKWQNKKLVFRTESQCYHVNEYHILHRLQRLSIGQKSGSKKATLSAVWMVNKLDGLRFIYMQRIKLN